jgi:ABC-2 type transport system permease protein
MLRSVFLKTLRDMRVALAWWAGGLGLMDVWFMTFYPAVAGASALAEYLDQMPESFLAMFGVTDAVLITTVEGFLTLELMSVWLPGLLLAFALTYGGNLISREEDDGSLDLLLSNPIPRWRAALEKFAALVVFTVIVSAASFLGLLAGARLVDVDVSSVHLWDGAISVTALTLFFAALAFCLTCLKRARGLALGTSAGLAVVTFFTYTMGDLAKLPEWVQRLSPWYYYDGGRVLIDGMLWENAAVLLGSTALLVALGVWGFGQRDLGT